VIRVCFLEGHRPDSRASSRHGRVGPPHGQEVTTRPPTRPVQQVGYRLLVVLAGAMLAVWAGASPVWAHNTLTSTNPADQEMVQRPPQAVVLTFDVSVIATGTQVVVTGPSGQVQQSEPRLAENTVSQDLQPGAPAGTYTVAWRVTSADGHPVSGTFSFTAKPAATQLPASPQTSPPTTPNQTQPTRMPGWLKLVIGVVAIIFGVTVARRASRRGNDPP
jgi:methionine-rich copper-binding protein CopC